jgi:hypothetical protein
MLVDSPVLCMLESPARRSFKRAAGHENHFLITIHVGLSAVQTGIAKLPTGMRVGWDPRDCETSAERSRGFANKAALAWTIDTLEAYLDFLRVEPDFASQEIREGLRGAIEREEGIAGKIRAAAKDTGQGETPEAVLAEIGVAWRNRLVHQKASSKAKRDLVAAARRNADHYLEVYSGMHIDELIERADARPAVPPTLKEVTAIIRAIQKLVEKVDEYVLGGVVLPRYLTQVLARHLVDDADSDVRGANKRAGQIWGKSEVRVRSKIVEIAHNNGFSDFRQGSPNSVRESEVMLLARMTPAEAVRVLAPQMPGGRVAHTNVS